MHLYGSLCVLMGLYESLWVFMGHFKFLCVRIDPDGSLLVFMRLYVSLRVPIDLLRLCASLMILIGPWRSL